MNYGLSGMALQLLLPDSGSWFAGSFTSRVWTELVSARVNSLLKSTVAPDLLGEALGGRLRGDAGMLRQASSNVLEAKSMMDTASSGVGSIAQQIGEAQELVTEFNEAVDKLDPLDPDFADKKQALVDQYTPLYESMGKSIAGIVKNTAYNGIALLDGEAWAGDERIHIVPSSGDPVAGSVHIQAGTDGFPLAFNNLRPQFGDIGAGNPLDDPDTAAGLSELKSTAESLAGLYAGRASSLNGQALSLKSQAAVLEEAALRRAGLGSSAPDPHSLLLDLALRDTGGLIDTRS